MVAVHRGAATPGVVHCVVLVPPKSDEKLLSLSLCPTLPSMLDAPKAAHCTIVDSYIFLPFLSDIQTTITCTEHPENFREQAILCEIFDELPVRA